MSKKNKSVLIVLAIVLAAAIAGSALFFNSRNNATTEGKYSPEIIRIEACDNIVKIYINPDKRKGETYIKKKVDGDFEKIGNISEDKSYFTDNDIEDGKKYSYIVVNKKGKREYESSRKTVKIKYVKEPEIKTLKEYNSNGKPKIQLSWEAKKNHSYSISRSDEDNNWEELADITAESDQGVFLDKNVNENTEYEYSVREYIEKDDDVFVYSSFNNAVKNINVKPDVKADFQNMEAVLTWGKSDNADFYKIYRKKGKNGKYRCIGTTEENTYRDVYEESLTSDADKKLICAESFVDPSINSLVYTVRAVKKTNDTEIYSDYYKDGVFHMETPTIVDVKINNKKKAEFEWATLKNAESYILYSGRRDTETDKIKWHKACEVKALAKVRQKAETDFNEGDTYFTVKAKFIKDGKAVYSGYDDGFTIEKNKYQNNNVLFIGDSITYGSPYKSMQTKNVFAYPWRFSKITGAKIYNPSIPGATYRYRDGGSRDRMVVQVAKQIRNGETPYANDKMLDFGDNGHNTQKYKDFDVVVMACGTNDYSDNAPFGSIYSNDITEFNGAVNEIMKWIDEGSRERVKEGKAPIKVVFVDLFYSDRTKNHSIRTNRYITKNGLGLTLTDYKANISRLISKYRAEGFEIYEFNTDEFVDESSCPYVTSDNLHMSRYTYAKVGNRLSDFMIEQKIIK